MGCTYDNNKIKKDISKNQNLAAYLKVLRVCSHDPELGDMQDIITVREFPMKESLRTSVNLLPLKGMWPWSLSKALIHSFNASKLLLISAPSNLVCLSLSVVSAPRSLPARSMKESLPTRRGGFDWFPSACEREDSSFAPVVPVLLVVLPLSISVGDSVLLQTDDAHLVLTVFSHAQLPIKG